MSTAIAAKKLSTRPVEPGDRQRARQSKRHPDCRSTTIKLTVTQISLALSSGRDNHPPAATAEMGILIVAVVPSRLSRFSCAGRAFGGGRRDPISQCEPGTLVPKEKTRLARQAQGGS